MSQKSDFRDSCATSINRLPQKMQPCVVINSHLTFLVQSLSSQSVRSHYVVQPAKYTLCLRKKCTNFKTLYVEIVRIEFDETCQKYSEDSRIDVACFSFCVGLLFINFSSFKPDTKITQIPKLCQASANFVKVHFLSIYLSLWFFPHIICRQL